MKQNLSTVSTKISKPQRRQSDLRKRKSQAIQLEGGNENRLSVMANHKENVDTPRDSVDADNQTPD